MNRIKGFTLIELMITIMIIGIIAAMAFPSFTEIAENRRIKGAADELYAVMMNARSLALKKSTDIRVNFSGDGSAAWAWGITDKTDGNGDMIDCDPTKAVANSGDDSCTIDYDNDPATDDPVLKRSDSSEYPGVSLNLTFPDDRVTFDGVRGIVAGAMGTATVSDGARQISVVVSMLGRARLCEPNGSTLGYYDEC